MESFYIEVFVKNDNSYSWKKLRPTGGQPYEFKDYASAAKTVEMCYPMHSNDVRITHGER